VRKKRPIEKDEPFRSDLYRMKLKCQGRSQKKKRTRAGHKSRGPPLSCLELRKPAALRGRSTKLPQEERRNEEGKHKRGWGLIIK